jgi:hypothetical protein
MNNEQKEIALKKPDRRKWEGK